MAKVNAHRKWCLLVQDANSVVIHRERFWTRWGARRHGERITSPPLNRYKVIKVDRWDTVS